MSSLANCLKKHGAGLSDFEIAEIKKAAKAYRDEGFKAGESNLSAVEDILKDLEAERVGILDQAEKQGWRPPTIEADIEVKEVKGEKVVTTDLTEKEGDKLTLKEQKAYLLAEIDKAIEDAPVEIEDRDVFVRSEDLSNRIRANTDELGGMYGELTEEQKVRREELIREQTRLEAESFNEYVKFIDESGQYVTIEVPGDGVFRILNRKAELEQFKKESKAFPTTAFKKKELPGVPKLAKPSAFRKESVGELIKVKQKGWFTDGHIAVKGTPPKNAKYAEGKGVGADISAIIPDKKNTDPAELLYYAFVDPKGEGVSFEPTAGIEEPDTYIGNYVIFESQGKKMPYDQKKFNIIRNRYPDAKYRALKENPGTGPLVAYDKGKVVAIIMPLRIELPGLEMAIEAGIVKPAPEADILPSTITRTKDGNITAESVEGIVIPYIRGMTNFPVIRVVQSLDQLSPNLKKAASQYSKLVKGSVEGFYHPESDMVYMIADNLSADRVETVLRHEAEGHRGIRLLMGDALNPFLNNIAMAKKNEIEAANPGLNFDDKEAVRKAADEWVAGQIEGGTLSDNWWDKLVKAFREWLRKIIPNLKMTETEIRANLVDAVRLVREGRAIGTIRDKGLLEGEADIRASIKKEVETTEDPYEGTSDEVRGRLQKAKISKPKFISEAKDKAIEVWRTFTRRHQRLDPDRYGETLNILRLFGEVPGDARRRGTNAIDSFTANLTPKRYEIFTMGLYMPDMMKDIESGLINDETGLPFGFKNADEAQRYADIIQKKVNSDPLITQAIEDRQEYMSELKLKAVRSGILKEEVLKDDRYVHHQVLEYFAFETMGREYKIGQGVSSQDVKYHKKGWEKARKGSAKEYNTDYIEAEHEVISQMLAQIETVKTLKRLKNLLDEKSGLDQQAKQENINIMWEVLRSKKQIEIDEKTGEEIDPLGIYKTIGDRNKFIKDTIGRRAVTYKKFMPEGYTDWRPKADSMWFITNSMTDRYLEEVKSGERAFDPEKLQRVLAKGADETWVIPQDVADTLDNFRSLPSDNILAVGSRRAMTAWKKWILINPFRVVKYNINNLSGDTDIALAYDPKIVKNYMPKALKDLIREYRGKETPEFKAELEELYRLGIASSGWSAQEVEDIASKLNFNQHLETLMGDKPNIIKRFWRTSQKFTRYRENILRIAAFRYFKDELKAGKHDVTWGASNRKEVAQIKDDTERAAKLARDLVGDYGNISEAGQWIRSHMIPFYSWMELNAPRYVRLMRNLPHEGKSVKAISGVATWRAAKLGVKASMLYALVMLWNRLFFSDEDDELGEAKRRQLHLILGRRDDGSIISLRFQGALSDALAWFGGEDIAHDIKDVTTGGVSVTKKLVEAIQAPMVKLGLGARPDVKIPVELLMERSFYPDIFFPRPIRDKWEHIARVFSIQAPYQWITGKPKRGQDVSERLFNDILSLGFYSSDPGEQAYYDVKKKIFDFLDKQGVERPSIIPTTKSNALYYYKQALKFGDLKAAEKYLKKYKKLGGNFKGIKISIRASAPIASLPKKYRTRFLMSLSSTDKKTYNLANNWYRKMYVRRRLNIR